LKSVITSKKKLREVLKQLYYFYLLASLKSIKPKIVISFIDNSLHLHWFSRKLKSITFFTIQNGNRANKQLDSEKKQYHKHFFCFGNYERVRYGRFGHPVEHCHPVGSLLTGRYKTKYFRANIITKYDIAIISQYSEKLFEKTKLEDKVKWNSMAKMHTFLEKYINEYNLKVAILLRNPYADSDIDGEKAYFDKFYKKKIVYICNDKNLMSPYNSMDQSELIVDCFSTASIEAFGWGKKILHCDFTGSKNYNDYDSMIMFTEPSYESFKKRLNELRREPYENYRKRTKKYASYLMNNSPECPPHIYIRKEIQKYL